MATTVNLEREVHDWIARNLGRGVPPQAVIQELMKQGTEPEVASAAVRAVAQSLEYVPDPLRIAAGPRLLAADREARVLARVQRPAAALLSGLLDRQECAALIELGRPRLTRSTVVDPVTGQDIVAGHRSSDGMFFQLAENPLVAAIEQRIAALTGIPAENGEGLQLLRYSQGAQSTPHFDYVQPRNEANRESIARSGQRIATLIMYLNDVEAGGETVFPATGFQVAPVAGQALYFESANRALQCDPLSLHAGAPVGSPEKWIATKWLRSQRFVPRGA